MALHVPLASEVRALRKKLGLTQAQVAKAAGVSQPLVARIENGTVDPRLSTYTAVLDALNRADRKSVLLSEVMATPVASVRATDTVSAAIRAMREKEISQLPVLAKGVPVGSLSDKQVVHALSEAEGAQELAKRTVGEIMGPPFPVAGPDMSVDQAARLLEDQAAILVMEKGKLIGIVAKADLLSLVR
ncbi:MAG TPA: CBS domain-containing protein [Candidatus Thermoplasmatota archaeon]|nr:CBS domain-containing protein [Candidatus Thermoplasmatota archaeon]